MSLVLIPDGPGTTVEVRDGQQGLPPAPRGSSAIMGQFSSGPVTHAALALNPASARVISGEPDDDFEGSLALDDLYSEDTPPVLIGRVTDGLEVQAQFDIWDRNPDRSFLRHFARPERVPLATGKANNGGRWGGRKRVLVGTLDDITVDLTSNTIDISTSTELASFTFLEDLLKDAEITLTGDTGGPYTVVESDVAGLVTIKGEFSQAVQDADGTGAIDGGWQIVLGHSKELAIVIAQDSITKQEFSLTGQRKFDFDADWEITTSYDNLTLANSESRPWIKTIVEGEKSIYQIEIETTFDPGGTTEAKLPANYCELPTDVTDATATFQWYRWNVGNTNTGDGYLGTMAAEDTSLVEPHTWDLTFTTATDFDVTLTWPDGSQETFAAGTVGVEYTTGHPQLSKFTVIAGGVAFVATDTLRIRAYPFPHDLAQREAFLYPIAVSADGDSNQRLRIASSTYNSVSVRSDLDLAGTYGAAAGTGATASGTVDLTAVSLGGGDTVIITPDSGTAITLTSAGSGPGAAAIAVELNALDTNNVFTFEADPADTTKLKVTVNGSYGIASSLTFGAGTGHAALGLPTTGTVNGTDGKPARIEARWPMWGGYDGAAPAAARYIIAADVSDSIFKRWLTTNLGLVRVGTPGITDTSVKTALRLLVEKNGWMYIAEFAASLEASVTPGEAAIADMLSNESESDFVEHYFPSRYKVLNVARSKTVTRSHVGLVMGIRARLANVGIDGEKGMHIAAANNNPQGKLNRAVGLPDDLGGAAVGGRWTPPVKLLNDHGIVPAAVGGTGRVSVWQQTVQQGSYPCGSSVYHH